MMSYQGANLAECIERCNKRIRSATFSRFDFKSKVDKHEAVSHVYEKKDRFDYNSVVRKNAAYPVLSNESLISESSHFYPSRTIAVQNFLAEAETHVQSFVAMFGTMEICEIIKDDRFSLAIVQYKSKTSAADALLGIPHCQVRGSNLVVHLVWNGPYENVDPASYGVTTCPKECSEKRVVCVGHLPRTISPDTIFHKCNRYGRVDDVKVQPQEQGAFAFVLFRSAFSAAVATYCLRNSTTSSAALLLGYSNVGAPVLLGPVRVRPLDQYQTPLCAFDVRCICTRFLDYSRLKGLFINLQRKLPSHHVFRPGSPDYCVRIPTTQVKGVSLFLEVLLFDRNFLKNADDISDLAYQMCNHKHLFRFSVDFGLHKPIMVHDEQYVRPNHHFLRWNSFFILDLQACYPWEASELRLHPRLQSMNHVYSDIDSSVYDSDSHSFWFGSVLRHTTCNLSTEPGQDESQHRNKIKFLLMGNLPFVRLVGSSEDINTYQIPVHVYSDTQSKLKTQN